MNPQLPAVLAALTCCLFNVIAVQFENCAPDNELAEWTEVSVLGCSKKDSKCTLHRGQKVTITIDFTNKKREWRVLSKVCAIIAGLELPFTLKKPDACRNTGLTCPLSPGNHTYTYSFVVDKEKPKWKHVIVKWQILNEMRKPLVCVLIPARLQ